MTFMRSSALAAALFASTSVAALADWPTDRPIEMIVAFAPGGGTDIMLRTLAPFVDATNIVVAAETTAASETVALRDDIDAVGGNIAGVVMNRSTWTPPAILNRLAG